MDIDELLDINLDGIFNGKEWDRMMKDIDRLMDEIVPPMDIDGFLAELSGREQKTVRKPHIRTIGKGHDGQ